MQLNKDRLLNSMMNFLGFGLPTRSFLRFPWVLQSAAYFAKFQVLIPALKTVKKVD